jgi:ribose 5-phosphate isomerase B
MNNQHNAGKKSIPIASDHGGYEIKQFLVEELTRLGYEMIDMGTHSEESVDYPDFIHPLAKAINAGKYDKGIILCGSGNGAQITANKYQNVRAALGWNVEQARLGRQHNNANVLSIPGRFVDKEEALAIALTFLKTDFEGGRHQRRVNKIPIR